MSQGFPLFDLLAQITGKPGTTDVTLYSTGRVAVRQNTQLSVITVEALNAHWRETVVTHFPGRPVDPRVGYTSVIKDEKNRRYRATLTAQVRGEAISVRPLCADAKTPQQLRLPEGLREYFLGLRSGLFLVGGPTGSGKSTTIASLLGCRRESTGGKVVTIEDPIEFIHADNERTIFDQREIGQSVLSYADGLKEALHMNPDIISVQEIREAAAAETALSAALSGHLVIGSLHAFTGPTAPQRYLSIINPAMEDLGARDALASCLEAVVVQKLVPGYEGLVPLFEVMLFRDRGERLPAMERLVRQGNWIGLRQEMETGRRIGMMLWEDSRRRRVEEGLIPGLY